MRSRRLAPRFSSCESILVKPVIATLVCLALCACTSSTTAVQEDAGADAAVDAATDSGVDSGVDAGTDASVDAGDAGPSERRIFVTATVQTGSMGGIAGADEICATQADAAGLEGEFRAWLSTLASPVSGRLVESTVPYVLVDGTVIADDWDDLTDDSIQAPIDLDATGQPRGGDVWTGTLPSGEPYDGGDCDGFTSDSSGISLCGSTQFVDTRWSAAQTPSCSTRLRLFCIEQ